jgi:hypothetical protein
MDTAVWAALFHRRVEVLRAMIGSKADFNGGWPHTPLTVAARTKDLDLIRVLVEGGAEVNRPNSSFETPLLVAVMENHAEVAAELVRLGADPTLIPRKKKYETVTNYSPLQYAAMSGDKKLVAILASAPASTKAGKALPGLLLCGAATTGDLAEVKRLVERDSVDVNVKDAKGETPLICAAMNGRAKVVRYLLDKGADVNLAAGTKSDGISPLLAAVMSGKVETVRMLVEAGGDLDYTDKDYEEGNALTYAKDARLKKVVEYLLDVEKQRGDGSKKKKAGAKPAGPRGVTTFDTNDAMVLVAAPVTDVSRAFAERIGAKTRRENVLGEEVKLTQRCYAVWKLIDSPWSNVMKLHCRDFRHWPSAADAVALSKSLKTRALYVANSDTGGVTQYALFDAGKVVEVFDYGSAGDRDSDKAVTERFAKYYSIDMSAIAGGVQVAQNKTFASSQRAVDVKKIKNDLDFVNDYVKQQDAFIPFGFEMGWGEAGEMMELTLEGLGPDDVERLDYVAAK